MCTFRLQVESVHVISGQYTRPCILKPPLVVIDDISTSRRASVCHMTDREDVQEYYSYIKQRPPIVTPNHCSSPSVVSTASLNPKLHLLAKTNVGLPQFH